MKILIFNFYDNKDKKHKEVNVSQPKQYLHVYPSSNGWGIYHDYKTNSYSEHLNIAALIMEVEDKELAENICNAFNNWASFFSIAEIQDLENEKYNIQQEAYDEGHDEGYNEGYEDGYEDARASILLTTKRQIQKLLDSLEFNV